MNVWPLLNIFRSASQSNHLATDHQRHWRQCDDVGDYDEQGDAKGVVMHRPLVASVYNYLQTCEDEFSCFWRDETKSECFSYVVNTRYCKYFEDSSCTDTQLTNQSCESCLRQILPQTSPFVLNWICLGKWVRVKHLLNVFHVWIGWNKSWWKTYRS